MSSQRQFSGLCPGNTKLRSPADSCQCGVCLISPDYPNQRMSQAARCQPRASARLTQLPANYTQRQKQFIPPVFFTALLPQAPRAQKTVHSTTLSYAPLSQAPAHITLRAKTIRNTTLSYAPSPQANRAVHSTPKNIPPQCSTPPHCSQPQIPIPANIPRTRTDPSPLNSPPTCLNYPYDRKPTLRIQLALRLLRLRCCWIGLR